MDVYREQNSSACSILALIGAEKTRFHSLITVIACMKICTVSNSVIGSPAIRGPPARLPAAQLFGLKTIFLV